MVRVLLLLRKSHCIDVYDLKAHNIYDLSKHFPKEFKALTAFQATLNIKLVF